MTDNPKTTEPPAQMDFRAFEAAPGVSIIVLANDPQFTHVAVSNDFLSVSGMKREDLINKGHFEVFRQVFDDENYDGLEKIRESFREVIRTGQRQEIPLQRYDLPQTDGSSIMKYWAITNAPLFDPGGKVAYIIHSATDITDRIQAVAKSEASLGIEKAYNLFMDAPVAVCIVHGKDHIVELANEAMLRFIGRTSEMVGRPLVESLTEAGSQGLLAILDRIRATGQPFHAPNFPGVILINGVREQRYFDLVFKPDFDNPGDTAPARIFCVAHNITTQVLYQKNMEESEYRFRTLIEEASVATALYFGRELKIQYVNDIMLRYWGKDKSVFGRTLIEALPELEGQPFLSQFDTVYTTGEPYQGVEQEALLNIDGTLKQCYFNYTFKALRDKQGVIYGIHHMAVDVTEQVLARRKVEESEANLRNTIIQSPIAMSILKGPEFVIEIANDPMCELWGRPREEIINRTIFDALPEARNQGYEELLSGVFNTGDSFSGHGIPVVLPRPAGPETVYIDLLYKALREGDGRITGIIAAAIDVTQQVKARKEIEDIVAIRTTELARANEALSASNRELARSNVNLGEFAYAASHDLKEPIRKIHFFGERIKETMSDRMSLDERRYFERMELATKRMGALIDDLLSYSQINFVPENLDQVDLNKLIELVLEDLDLEIEAKGARVQVDNLTTIKGHARQLQQAFQNLISNALKYNRPGLSPEVHISCGRIKGHEAGIALSPEEQELDFYKISVTDNGIGFEQEDAERIFNVFTRLHGNTEYRGTGIGLSIVRKVVENHQGHIWASSVIGEGSTFNLILPADKAQ